MRDFDLFENGFIAQGLEYRAAIQKRSEIDFAREAIAKCNTYPVIADGFNRRDPVGEISVHNLTKRLYFVRFATALQIVPGGLKFGPMLNRPFDYQSQCPSVHLSR